MTLADLCAGPDAIGGAAPGPGLRATLFLVTRVLALTALEATA